VSHLFPITCTIDQKRNLRRESSAKKPNWHRRSSESLGGQQLRPLARPLPLNLPSRYAEGLQFRTVAINGELIHSLVECQRGLTLPHVKHLTGMIMMPLKKHSSYDFEDTESGYRLHLAETAPPPFKVMRTFCSTVCLSVCHCRCRCKLFQCLWKLEIRVGGVLPPPIIPLLW
jgi:hypothetical protein